MVLNKITMIIGLILFFGVISLAGCSKQTIYINTSVVEVNDTYKVDTNTTPPIKTIRNLTLTPVNLNVRTKNSSCTFDNWPYPDYACTPGSVFAEATKEIICSKGYSAEVRAVSASTKKQVYAQYNMTNVVGVAEVDHLISLELGGSNSISNLWPEKYNDTMGARVKDKVENKLHKMVCEGTITLQQAQYDIAYNWTKYS